MKRPKLWTALAFLAGIASSQSAIIISQYVETNSSTTPKGIELWNSGGSVVDFSVDNLVVNKGTNGGALSSDFNLNSGTIAPGEVIVIGTSDIGAYLDATFGSGVIQFFVKTFTFNGNDALSIVVGASTQDVFGTPGSDPGSAWTGGSVSTANQNIELNPGITTGDVDGWADPSERFSTASTDPVGAGGLAGFGIAPIPEPSIALLGGLGILGLLRRRR
jgi:hypothetical protein